MIALRSSLRLPPVWRYVGTFRPTRAAKDASSGRITLVANLVSLAFRRARTRKSIVLVHGLLAGVERARREIRQGRFQRSMALIAAFSAIVSGYEAWSQHVRGAFRQWEMWTPVWLMVPTALVSVASVVSRRAARLLLPVASVAALLDGVVGFWLHLRGIARLPGGFRLGQYNVVMGPPIFAPLLITIVGFLGVLASLLRPEQLEYLLTGNTRSRRSDFSNEPRPARPADRLAHRIPHGRFQPLMAFLAGFLALLSGGEAYFEHLRGSFNQRWMWIPIWVTLPMLMVVWPARSNRAMELPLALASALNLFTGLLGLALHLRGIYRMPGRFNNLRFNATIGPPLFAPLLFSAVGLLGLIASLLRTKED